jgi:GNAT superfamily N-acetyltransferase
VVGQVTDKRLDITIALLQEMNLAEADRVFRLAFASEHNYPEGQDFAPGSSLAARFKAQPEGAFGAFADDELLAVAYCSTFGSIGVLGPIAVSPRFWGRGIAQQLLNTALQHFSGKGITKLGLSAFPGSVKHVSLYYRYGYSPRFLIASMFRPLAGSEATNGTAKYLLFSRLSPQEKADCLESAQALTSQIYQGLSFNRHMVTVDEFALGDVIVLLNDSSLLGFAVCHWGAGSEAETNACYIKLAAIAPGDSAAAHFNQLLQACLSYAKSKGATELFAGTSTARYETFEAMLSFGFKIRSLTVSMHNPNEPFYNHAGAFVIDDWR